QDANAISERVGKKNREAIRFEPIRGSFTSLSEKSIHPCRPSFCLRWRGGTRSPSALAKDNRKRSNFEPLGGLHPSPFGEVDPTISRADWRPSFPRHRQRSTLAQQDSVAGKRRVFHPPSESICRNRS